MDVGGFRDMHRHRRCIQILQPLTAIHGFATPALITEMGYEERYANVMRSASDIWNEFQISQDTDTASGADYALPLGFRRRSLFKMDFAQVAYICELRTAPAGHFSYRDVAYKMYEKVVRVEPSLSTLIRVTKPQPDDNILKR